MSLYFNPVAQGEESLELAAQVVEKAAIEQLAKVATGCCRVDFRFEVMQFTVRGINIFREDFDQHKIKDFLVPGEQISALALQVLVGTPFCCCDDGCSIF